MLGISNRRQWLTLAACALARAASPRVAFAGETARLVAREVTVPNPGRFGKRCLLLRPSRVPESTPLPLLVLFHGLGETVSEDLGIHAWADRYGLLDAYARLTAPPVTRTLPNKRYLSDERLQTINTELSRTPLPDIAIVCPFTPNPFKQDPSAPLLDAYAAYIEQKLLPAVRAATPCRTELQHLGVDGVSLGGYVALEIFLRKPELFGSIGTMQGAFGKQLAEVYARRMAEVVSKHGSRAIHVLTSSFDPFREASVLFAARLRERSLLVTELGPEGPHEQTFLREAGTLEMLLFQARALGVT